MRQRGKGSCNHTLARAKNGPHPIREVVCVRRNEVLGFRAFGRLGERSSGQTRPHKAGFDVLNRDHLASRPRTLAGAVLTTATHGATIRVSVVYASIGETHA